MFSADDEIRTAALAHVQRLRAVWGDAVPESELAKGFVVRGERILLKGPQGIFKPKQLSDGPLTIISTLGSRYEDELLEDANRVRYDFAPRSREHENDGMKRVMAERKPVILLMQVKPKPRPEYMIVAPLFVEDYDNSTRQFALSTQPADIAAVEGEGSARVLREIRRAYGEATVRTRLHQAHFREDVLAVYRGRCCVCELQTRPLLQGAHIVPDSDAMGVPSVQNGLSLCALHHAAYDRDILRIDPEYHIKVERRWVKLGDRFGRVALSEFDGHRIVLPKQAGHCPDPAFLESRFGR